LPTPSDRLTSSAATRTLPGANSDARSATRTDELHRHHPSAWRSRGLAGVRLAVSVALLAFLFSRIDAGTLWQSASQASVPWMLAALALYFMMMLASTWRWRLLLGAQNIDVSRRALLSSYLVAIFFNNFLPSNIGGDVVRIRDTAGHTRSKTLATTIILIDRILGMLGLVLVAAVGATLAGGIVGGMPSPIWPAWLWAGFLVAAALTVPAVLMPAGVGRLLRPLTVVHPTWVGDRIEMLTAALARFRGRPGALAACFGGAIGVQALLVGYHFVIAIALHVPVTFWVLAIIVPISFIAQMIPVSVNGFGVREATFAFYFARLGLPVHSAILISLTATGLMMIFSLSGAAIYVSRPRRNALRRREGDQGVARTA
jgi:uncharacterized membrane protein YbhN (UPF0104 family)